MSRKIKSLLVLKGVKQRAIAQKLNVSDNTISRVIYGKTISLRVRQAIAQALGLRVEQLWPKKIRRRAT